MHLAHQIVLLFIKQQFCSHDYLGCFVLSSWYPSNQSLLFITSRCSGSRSDCELQRWLTKMAHKDGSVPPTGFLVNGLRACSAGQAEMDAVFFSVQVREGQHWKGYMLKAVKLARHCMQ